MDPGTHSAVSYDDVAIVVGSLVTALGILSGVIAWLATRLFSILVARAADERERTMAVTKALERNTEAMRDCGVIRRGGP